MDRREVPMPAPPCRLTACGRRRLRLRGAAGLPLLSCAAAMAVPRVNGSKIMVPAPIRIMQRRGERRRAISPPSPDSWPTEPYVSQGQVDQCRRLGGCLCDGGIDRRCSAVILPPPSVSRRAGDRRAPIRCAAKSSLFRHSPNTAKHRERRCFGCPPKMIIFSARDWWRNSQPHFRMPAAMSLWSKRRHSAAMDINCSRSQVESRSGRRSLTGFWRRTISRSATN